jgi:hypothetical protein
MTFFREIHREPGAIWNSMTPTELADAMGMRRREVIARCNGTRHTDPQRAH